MGSPEAGYDPEIGDLSRPHSSSQWALISGARMVWPTVVMNDPAAGDQILRPPLMPAARASQVQSQAGIIG